MGHEDPGISSPLHIITFLILLLVQFPVEDVCSVGFLFGFCVYYDAH